VRDIDDPERLKPYWDVLPVFAPRCFSLPTGLDIVSCGCHRRGQAGHLRHSDSLLPKLATPIQTLEESSSPKLKGFAKDEHPSSH